MAKDPAVLFYTSDFISGTITMTHEERGIYILLLCLQHQQGKLTEREIEKYKEFPEVIFKFKKLSDGFYYNIRMKEQTETRKKYSESRRNNRKGKSKDSNIISKSYDNHMINISTSYVKHMENENENVNINDNINGNEANILDKLLDKLLDITTFKTAMNEIKEYGGIEKVFDKLEYDDSVKNNWRRMINERKMILNGQR